MKRHMAGAIIFAVLYLAFLISYFSILFSPPTKEEILPIDFLRVGCEIGLIANAVAYYVFKKNQPKQREIEREQSVTQAQKALFEREYQQFLTQKSDFEKEKQNLIEKENYVDKKIKELDNTEKKIAELNKVLKEINKRVEEAESELLIAETTVFDDYDNITSEEIKDKISLLKIEYKDFVKSNEAVIQTNPGAYSKKSRLNDNIKQILRCFNSEASNIISTVTATNIEKQRGALTKSFETINSLFTTDSLALDRKLLEYRLRELNLVYSYQKRKAQEQEEQKAIRAQMLEEEKVRREIEREKAKVEKEEAQFKNEVDKLMKYLSKTDDDVQKQLYVDKIKELEEKLKLLEKDKENILQREQNTRAGFVYIISNIGSFGENIYKIGMTRRLEPMDRIDELGSASVPFPFDVHAMIFSDDAPALETILHNTFKDCQVNLVNPRKEFYNVSLNDIEKVVKENYNATVTFTQVAQAAQYRESVRLRQTKESNRSVITRLQNTCERLGAIVPRQVDDDEQDEDEFEM